MKSAEPLSPPPRPLIAKMNGSNAGARTAAAFSVEGAWVCHVGKVRRRNEDACMAGEAISTGAAGEIPTLVRVTGDAWILAVSDGIGGHREGAEASRQVIATLADCKPVAAATVREVLQRLNRELCRRGQREGGHGASGATVAGIACGVRGLFAFNVGDSRVFECKDGRLAQITRDDSEAEELIARGLLTGEAGARPNFLHALTQAIGGRSELVEIEPHIHTLEITSRRRFLICSDGLTDMLGASEIEATLCAEHDSESAVATLFAKAMAAGGADNITIVVADIAPV